MKKEQKQEWDANTVYSLYITPPLPACIVYDCREDRGVIIGNTQSVSIPFLFLFFFHQSSLYPFRFDFVAKLHKVQLSISRPYLQMVHEFLLSACRHVSLISNHKISTQVGGTLKLSRFESML